MQESFSRRKEGQFWEQRELQLTTALFIWVTKRPQDHENAIQGVPIFKGRCPIFPWKKPLLSCMLKQWA